MDLMLTFSDLKVRMQGSTSSRRGDHKRENVICPRCNIQGMRKVSHSSQKPGWVDEANPTLEKRLLSEIEIVKHELRELKMMFKILENVQSILAIHYPRYHHGHCLHHLLALNSPPHHYQTHQPRLFVVGIMNAHQNDASLPNQPSLFPNQSPPLLQVEKDSLERLQLENYGLQSSKSSSSSNEKFSDSSDPSDYHSLKSLSSLSSWSLSSSSACPEFSSTSLSNTSTSPICGWHNECASVSCKPTKSTITIPKSKSSLLISSNDSFLCSKSSSSSNEKFSDSSDPSDCHSIKSLSSLSSWSLSSPSVCPKFSCTSLSNTSTSPVCGWHNECTSKSCKPRKSTITIPKPKSFAGSEEPIVASFFFDGLGVACDLVKGLLGHYPHYHHGHHLNHLLAPNSPAHHYQRHQRRQFVVGIMNAHQNHASLPNQPSLFPNQSPSLSLSSLSSWSLSSSSACLEFPSTSLSNTSTLPVYGWHNECTSKSCKPTKSTITISKSKSSPGSEVPIVATFFFEGLGTACDLTKGLRGLQISEGLFCLIPSNDSFSSSKSSSSSNEKFSNFSGPSEFHSLKSLSSLSSWSRSSSFACPEFSTRSLSNTSTSPVCGWHNECTSKSYKPTKSTITIPKSKSSPASELSQIAKLTFPSLFQVHNLPC
ncbi:hypothetical protein Cgig2_017497 [Carnegiea gigantea]|uniref:Uncharacterized protein n=1 Tax=Carnegiea gigantea TaxID=171969 RepID=A0A9Q1QBV7_9CARY|nr:hypothetical protein Cgig2_017497 [Carnegiea gigantea]